MAVLTKMVQLKKKKLDNKNPWLLYIPSPNFKIM